MAFRSGEFRIICNEVARHCQWIVVHDSGDGRPVMVAGPFLSYKVAKRGRLHCMYQRAAA